MIVGPSYAPGERQVSGSGAHAVTESCPTSRRSAVSVSLMALAFEVRAHWGKRRGGAGKCSPVASACRMVSAVVWTLLSGSRRGDQGGAQPDL